MIRDRKLNLLLVAAGLGIGGAEVIIQQLAHTIDRSRFNIKVCCITVCGPIGAELQKDGTEVIVLSDRAGRLSRYFTFLKLLRVIRRHEIDVVHTHTTSALFDAALCRMLSSRFRLIHTFHYGNYPHRAGRELWFERVGARFADQLLAVGDEQRRQVNSTFGFREGRVGRLWNGVPFPRLAGDNGLRATIGGDRRIVIGSISTLIEQKGLFDFLAAAARFREQSDRVRFVIIGDGVLRPKLEAARNDLGLQESVVFTGWLLGASQVGLPAIDIFFQPSLWEAMSIALLEAMAAGKAIVTTRVGETPHIIRDGVDGLLVAPGDVDGMVRALRRLVDDEDLRRRYGESAARRAMEQFSVDRMTRAHEQVYLALR